MPFALMNTHGRVAPVITCDVCGERITDPSMANLMWHREVADGEATTDYVTVHKRTCTPVADELAPDYLLSQELDVTLYRLWSNAGLTAEDHAKLARRHATLEAIG